MGVLAFEFVPRKCSECSLRVLAEACALAMRCPLVARKQNKNRKASGSLEGTLNCTGPKGA
eukprot:3933669-Rhodomonas_salina.1